MQFLDPEIVKMDDSFSGSRNRKNGVISGSRNQQNGRQILYGGDWEMEMDIGKQHNRIVTNRKIITHHGCGLEQHLIKDYGISRPIPYRTKDENYREDGNFPKELPHTEPCTRATTQSQLAAQQVT